VRNYAEHYVKVVAPAQPAIICHKRQFFNILLLPPPLGLTAKLEAEGVGFEPTFAKKAKAVFKTATISHSVTPPGFKFYCKTTSSGNLADLLPASLPNFAQHDDIRDGGTGHHR
jgi:hypothetical protein